MINNRLETGERIAVAVIVGWASVHGLIALFESIGLDINLASAQVSEGSPVDLYNEAVRQDVAGLSSGRSGEGKPDLTGNGFGACVVNSDCLVGAEACTEGDTPNTEQMPGYCVPNDFDILVVE